MTKPFEDVQPVHAGHFEVHQNDIGGLTTGIGERGFSFQVRDEFPAITHDVEAPNIPAFGEGHLQEFDVARRIFGGEDIQLPLCALRHPLL